MRSRSKQVLVRMTPDEYAAITAAAREVGMTTTDYVIARAIASAQEAIATERIESALAGALDAHREVLESDLDAQTAKVESALRAFAKFLNAWGKKRADKLGRENAPAVAIGGMTDATASANSAAPETNEQTDEVTK